MCPSFRATGDEQHSTRGRARLLFEFASGRAGVDAAHADDVAGALDLCLSCKGCKRDCPVGVDMAAYKSEFLAQRYAGRRRPVTHYSLGWLPRWLRLVDRTRSAGLLNWAARRRALAALAKRLGGVTPERDIPPLAGESFQAWFGRRGARGPAGGPRLLVWPDTFTNYLEPAIGRDAVAALEALGYRVEVPSAPVCCGLTWHSTGQLGQAKKVLAATLAVLKPWLDDEVPIVGLEPSCLAALKTDAVELLPDDPAAKQASVSVRSLAEVLRPHLAELRARAAASPAAAPTAPPPPTATAAPATQPPPTPRLPQKPQPPQPLSHPGRLQPQPQAPAAKAPASPEAPSHLTGAGVGSGALPPARRPRL